MCRYVRVVGEISSFLYLCRRRCSFGTRTATLVATSHRRRFHDGRRSDPRAPHRCCLLSCCRHDSRPCACYSCEKFRCSVWLNGVVGMNSIVVDVHINNKLVSRTCPLCSSAPLKNCEVRQYYVYSSINCPTCWDWQTK